MALRRTLSRSCLLVARYEPPPIGSGAYEPWATDPPPATRPARDSEASVAPMRVCYMTTHPIWQATVPDSFPLPLVGEHIEIHDRRYVVRSRVWDLDRKSGDLGRDVGVDVRTVGVAFHVQEYGA